MAVLLTGANGQVGSAIRRRAKTLGVPLVALGSRELDVGSREAVSRVVQHFAPEAIINAAAYTAVDKAEQEPDLANSVNAQGPAWLAEAAARHQIPLLHFSTDYVFDGTSTRPYREGDPVAPLGVYGFTKQAGEEAIRNHHLQHLIFRTSWVFGLEGHNFPKTMLRLARERSEIGVVADQIGCPTYADDLAAMALAVLGKYRELESPWGTYHYAGITPCSWFELACRTLECARDKGVLDQLPRMRQLRTADYPTPARRPANSRLDCGKFRACFPDIPLSDWNKGIQQLVDHVKSTS